MRVVWDHQALDDFREFEAKQPKLAARIVALIADAKMHLFSGLGKPEPYVSTSPAVGVAASIASVAWCTK